MKITDLPFDCLLQIFHSLEKLDDLINCYRAHNQWEEVISLRLSKIKLLSNSVSSHSLKHLNNGFAWTQLLTNQLNGESDFYQLFSGVRILDLVTNYLSDAQLIYLAKNLPNIKIILAISNLPEKIPPTQFEQNSGDALAFQLDNMRLHETQRYSSPINSNSNIKSILFHFKNLEILKLDRFDYQQTVSLNVPFTNQTVKQLHLNWCNSAKLAEISKVFCNLQKLHIQNLGSFEYFPVFENLKVLIYSAASQYSRIHAAREVIAICPNLESGFFKVCTIRFDLFGEINNYSLKNLVLEFNESFTYPQYLEYLLSCLSKLKNLENLAIRYFELITDAYVVRLIHSLPKLCLLDLSDCPKITKAAESLVSNYGQVNNRMIQFIHHHQKKKATSKPFKLTNPNPSKICRDFDFMKNCFHRRFYDLPYFEDFNVDN